MYYVFIIIQTYFLIRNSDTAHVPSTSTRLSVGIRQVLKIHQGPLWTNNNICCDGAHPSLALCGLSLKCVLPSNRVWCPGLFYRPVSCGSRGTAGVWRGCQSGIRDQHILMCLRRLERCSVGVHKQSVCVCESPCITCPQKSSDLLKSCFEILVFEQI